ncbi:MAG: hypothetical protein SVM80_09945 [Halobacteriota archaeon]|nr:hypothetical protein [Halobacteriota archaeon]
MTAIEDMKKALEEDLDAKMFPTFLKAIEEISETSREIKERMVDIGAMNANFIIPEAKVEAHIKIKVDLSVSGGKGLFKNPDFTSVITEEVAKDAVLRKSSLTALWTDGMTSGKIKISGNLNKAMKQLPMLDEGDEALYGYKSKEYLPENVQKIKIARESGECDVELFATYLKAGEEMDEEFMRYIQEKYAKTGETIRLNYKIPSAGIGAHYGIGVKRSIAWGEGKLDASDITIKLTEELAKEIMTGKATLSSSYHMGYINLERRLAGKLMTLDPIFRAASEELGINI